MVYVEVYGNFAKFAAVEGGCPILNTITEADDTHPRLKAKAVDALLSWKDQIAGQIVEGINAKEFKADVNAEEMAVTIVALLEGAVLFTKATGKASYRKGIINSVQKLIQSL